MTYRARRLSLSVHPRPASYSVIGTTLSHYQILENPVMAGRGLQHKGHDLELDRYLEP